jgi:hypothetical protein
VDDKTKGMLATIIIAKPAKQLPFENRSNPKLILN